MKALSLLYHDAIKDGDMSESGYQGTGADIYKLDVSEMDAHFNQIAIAGGSANTPVHALPEAPKDQPPLMITFDDGGVSAATAIADLLEKRNWIGHFFITGERIGTDGFVSKEQIRALHRRGHIIGSHSWTHPTRMGKCSKAELDEEWRTSVENLSEILGTPIDTASVPGGSFSRDLVKSASEHGIRYLFTSEPVKSVREVEGCLLIGRFCIMRSMTKETSAALASRNLSAQQARAFLHWNTKKIAKKLGGNFYETVRDTALSLKRNRS